jgi:two-component system chemotaxis response regulator CheV
VEKKMSITNSNILLESGTNELEVLVFIVAGNSYGINVAKITELMQAQPYQPMPLSHPCVEGIFQPRDQVYTIIDLAKYLQLPPSEDSEKDIYIITSFNKANMAFHVHAVEGIHRISWESIEKPDSIIYGGDEGVVTGIAKTGESIISILDFEKITFDIAPQTGIDVSTVKVASDDVRSNCPILAAEDSALLRKMLIDSLTRAGYTHIIMKSNGEEAWEFLNAAKDHPEVPLREQVMLLITDIEMPKMDGHRLTKLVKSDPVLHEIPVVMFSSLIDEDMYKKGEELGAEAQLSKPEIANLVSVIDEILGIK